MFEVKLVGFVSVLCVLGSWGRCMVVVGRMWMWWWSVVLVCGELGVVVVCVSGWLWG